jgi:hypothetical protein
VPRWSLLTLALFAACGGSQANLDAATNAQADAAAPQVSAPDTSAPDPLLDTVMIRSGGERTLQHLACAGNAAGEGMALWRETDGEGKHQLWASHLTGGGWRPAESLGERPTADLNQVAVTVDAGGRALAVWNESDGPAAGVVGTRFQTGMGWTAPARIGPGWVLTLTGSAAGEAVAFGVLEGTPPTLLRYAPAAGWALDQSLHVEHQGFFFASPTGRGVMTWNQAAGAAGSELVASEYAGGTWSAPARIQEALPFDHPLPSVNASLAADGSGLLVWNRGGELQGALWAAATTGPGLWQPPQRLMDGEAPLWTTTVLVQESGAGMVTWESGMPPARKVWTALRAGGQWQPSVNVGEGSEFVTAALATSGSALVAWSTPRRMYGRHYAPGRGWGVVRLAAGDNGGVAGLCALIDDRGRGWMVWVSGSPQVLRAAPLAD